MLNSLTRIKIYSVKKQSHKHMLELIKKGQEGQRKSREVTAQIGLAHTFRYRYNHFETVSKWISFFTSPRPWLWPSFFTEATVQHNYIFGQILFSNVLPFLLNLSYLKILAMCLQFACWLLLYFYYMYIQLQLQRNGRELDEGAASHCTNYCWVVI